MGAPGAEHIDIGTLATAGRVRIVDFMRDLVDAYSSTSGAPPGEKVLYVARGDWVLPLTGQVGLPEQVEVMFAPGGRLIPVGSNAVLQIFGKITAPIGPIFMTSAGTSSALTPADRGSLGSVRLMSERLECVYPEWWGAGSLRHVTDLPSALDLRTIANEDTAAIEEAIRTASDWRPDPVVVDLLGTYLLARTVRVGQGPFPPTDTPTSADGEPTEFHLPVNFWDRAEVEVELRGRLRAPGDPTFRAHTGFVGDEMFDVRSVASFRIRGLSFDASGEALVCLAIRDPFQFTVTDAPHEITQCSFTGAFLRLDPSALLRLQRSHPYSATTDVELAHSAPNVVVDACMFSIASITGVAARLIGEGAAAAEFRGCTFVGTATTMIHASSFEVMASSCRFENSLIPTALYGSTPPDELTRLRVLTQHGTFPQGGLDVFLDSAQALPRLLIPPEPPPPQPKREKAEIDWWDILFSIIVPFYAPALALAQGLGWRDRTVWIAQQGSAPPAVPAAGLPKPQRSIYAQDCRSTSPQFLATAQNSNRSAMADGVIIGLHHEFRPTETRQSRPVVHPQGERI